MAQARAGRCIGILREVKNKWERRTPLVPQDVEWLVRRGTRVLIQPSPKRIFTDGEFRAAGAELTDDLTPANTILGVKEFPKESLILNKSYLIFSHTIKAQSYNMPFLDTAMQRKIRLFDYECIRAPSANGVTGGRLVAFGQYAGLAGMIDGLRGLGERLLSLGFSTPFVNISSAYMYPNIDAAKAAVTRCGDEIKRVGLPAAMLPFTVVFTGAGNVTQGAQAIFELLPHRYVSPSELAILKPDPHCIYAVKIDASHMVRPRGGGAFDKRHYYEHPDQYEPVFHTNIAPYTSMLVNGMYWDPRFPRLLTIDQHRQLQRQSASPLRSLLAVADITCDINGSVEMLAKSTSIEQPFFVYDSITNQLNDRIEGDGVLMLGVDNLPAEFPHDASKHFSQALKPFVESLAAIDNSQAWAEAENVLPRELANAAITADGRLTPNYQYIQSLRKTQSATVAEAAPATSSNSSTSTLSQYSRTYLLSGHLFDTNFINHALDLFEENSKDFKILFWNISPNRAQRENNVSQCVIEVQWEGEAQMAQCESALQSLTKVINKAQATVTQLAYNGPSGSAGLTPQVHGERPSVSSLSPSPSPTQSSASSTNVIGASRPRVLVLGSGYVAAPLIDWLGRQSFHIVAASNMLDEAQRMVQHLPYAEAQPLDARDESAMTRLIESSSLVVSLLPASMHLPVARACLQHGKHLVTASYISPDMAALDAAAKQKGLIFMNEIGLDPGIDHLTAVKTIDEAKERGAKLTHFVSLCGGLPAPDARDNPFQYKFSWSPAGMLGAATRPAKFRQGGKVIDVPGTGILSMTQPFTVAGHEQFQLEQYPNHDSLGYETTYGLGGMDTMYRGTLRYAGTAELMRTCNVIGLLDRQTVTVSSGKWCDLLVAKLDDTNIELAIRKLVQSAGMSEAAGQRAIEALLWLGALSPDSALPKHAISPFDAFCQLLLSKMTFAPHERDLVILTHQFKFQEAGGKASELNSTLIAYGGEGSRPTALAAGGGSGLYGFSAMARTVGLPAAIGASLVLKGAICERGVLIPTQPSVYIPLLDQLKREGITFTDTVAAA